MSEDTGGRGGAPCQAVSIGHDAPDGRAGHLAERENRRQNAQAHRVARGGDGPPRQGGEHGWRPDEADAHEDSTDTVQCQPADPERPQRADHERHGQGETGGPAVDGPSPHRRPPAAPMTPMADHTRPASRAGTP